MNRLFDTIRASGCALLLVAVGGCSGGEGTVGEGTGGSVAGSGSTTGSGGGASGGDATGGSATATGGSATGTGGSTEIPEGEYCDPSLDWPAASVALEAQVLELVNARRAAGATCGDADKGEEEVVFAPTGALTFDESLNCAARVHTLDMVERDFFDHTNPDGDGPGDRFGEAGYQGSGWGENIAAGSSTAEAVMNQWMNSKGHCENIMEPGFGRIGIGYVYGAETDYGHYWTQTFGS